MGAIILCSGGLDSVTAAFNEKKAGTEKIILLFVDYGQRTLNEELFCVKRVAEKLAIELKIIDMKWLGSISTALLNSSAKVPEKKPKDIEDVKKEKEDIGVWWVPCRNTLFVTAALAHAESLFLKEHEWYDIVLGIKKEGEIAFKDSRPEFVEMMNIMQEQATNDGGFVIRAPLIDLDKDEVVKKGKELGVSFEDTYSCYTGLGFDKEIPLHCGYCSNCLQRQAAFYWSGISDPSMYKKKQEF